VRQPAWLSLVWKSLYPGVRVLVWWETVDYWQKQPKMTSALVLALAGLARGLAGHLDGEGLWK
jgi:hypothetical protein